MLRLSSGNESCDLARATPGRTRSGGDREGHAGIPLGAAGGHRHGPDRQGVHGRGNPGDRRLVRRPALRSSRRDFLKLGLAATTSAALFPLPSFGQGAAPRVVVVGGGFAGASCARALRQLDPRLGVTLVEANATFTACPFSNAVITGLRELSAQQFTYERVAAAGIVLARQMATTVDAAARAVTLADGTRLPYDRLVLAPGIDIRWGA